MLYYAYQAACRRRYSIQTLKQEAIEAISRLPETASVDEMMYELYVIDKINKGREASRRGETVSTEELKEEIRSW